MPPPQRSTSAHQVNHLRRLCRRNSANSIPQSPHGMIRTIYGAGLVRYDAGGPIAWLWPTDVDTTAFIAWVARLGGLANSPGRDWLALAARRA